MLLKEIKLHTSRLSALCDFYHEVLELPAVKAGSNSITVTAGKSKLTFIETATTGNPFYHFAFNIPSNKFEEAFQWISNRVALLWLNDYKSYIADFINWHAKSLYFIDPAGNILEFIARHDLHEVVHEPFSALHILNVSEIGLVLPLRDFDKAVNDLLKRYGLSYFAKQPPMPHFRAVGNDEGLFVIVPENRTWFSTKDTLSQIFPLEIIFIENDRMCELKM
jgi:hypothetical protein